MCNYIKLAIFQFGSFKKLDIASISTMITVKVKEPFKDHSTEVSIIMINDDKRIHRQ